PLPRLRLEDVGGGAVRDRLRAGDGQGEEAVAAIAGRRSRILHEGENGEGAAGEAHDSEQGVRIRIRDDPNAGDRVLAGAAALGDDGVAGPRADEGAPGRIRAVRIARGVD